MHEKKTMLQLREPRIVLNYIVLVLNLPLKKKLCKNVHCVKGLKFTTSCIQTLAKCDCRQLYM